jgi:hypothetical protein
MTMVYSPLSALVARWAFINHTLDIVDDHKMAEEMDRRQTTNDTALTLWHVLLWPPDAPRAASFVGRHEALATFS